MCTIAKCKPNNYIPIQTNNQSIIYSNGIVNSFKQNSQTIVWCNLSWVEGLWKQMHSLFKVDATYKCLPFLFSPY